MLANKPNRLFRSRLYRLLWDQDLGDLGVKLIALDDTGNRFGDAMQDEFSEWEREEIAKRTQDGLLEYTGSSRDCGNRKYLRAEQIEEQVWEFVCGLLRDPERIRAGLDRMIEEERTNAGRDPERDAEFWSRKITEMEIERRGYHRLAAKGHMTDEELAAALSALDEDRETAERELEDARAKGEALQRLEHDRNALMKSYAGMVSETLEDLAPEERHRIYKLLRLGVRFRPDWPLEITGVFVEVGEEAETGSSKCKLSSLSV